MNKPKIAVAGWVMVDPNKRDERVKEHQELLQRARRAPGCLDLAISADPIDPGRINIFELWQSEAELDAWRAVANPPKEVTPILVDNVQKHEINKSGLPF